MSPNLHRVAIICQCVFSVQRSGNLTAWLARTDAASSKVTRPALIGVW